MQMIDYGTIKIHLYPNLTYDQMYSTVNMCVENQLNCTNRTHRYEILCTCVEEAIHIKNSVDINHTRDTYKFKTMFVLEKDYSNIAR